MTDVLGLIRKNREARGWTEYQLAERSGLPQSTISSWYQKGMTPSFSSLEKICDAFGLTLSQFFADGEALLALTPGQRGMLEKWLRLSPAQQRALFAVMDAMLGAAALGDIGKLFPDTDAAYQNISSLVLLTQVREKLAQAGYQVGNLDATIVAQRPKLAEFLPQMALALAKTLQVDPGQVNVKATTEEGLGFTGAGEGIAAHAVVLLERLN